MSTPLPQTVQIRQATLQDSEGILQCLRSAFAPYQHLYTPAAFEDTVLTPESLEQRLRIMSVLVAATGSGEIAGTIAWQVVGDDEGHLRGMSIVAEWQGRGIAQLLLDRAVTDLAEAGCTRITLDTTELLIPAMRFYERNGFRRSGKVSDFFGMRLIEYIKNID